MLTDNNPISILQLLWDRMVVTPWERVRCIHDSAPDPGVVQIGYRVVWLFLTVLGLTFFLVPVVEFIAVYAVIYYLVGGIIRALKKVGVLG